MSRRKPKLKTGTRQYGKPASAVSLAPCPWDMGADGPANRIGLVRETRGEIDPETGKVINPNGVEGMKRKGLLDLLHGRWVRQQRIPNTDQLMPYITTRQFNVAVDFRNAFELTMCGPGWPDNDRVQSSPKPDHAVTIQIDRIAKYHAIACHMRAQDWPIIRRCVIEGNEPVTTAGYPTLREALDWIADGLENIRKNRT